MKVNLNLYVLFIFLGVTQYSLGQNWTLVWQDEFNGSIGPDWVFETGNGYSGWGNNELQYYRRENASIENGNLVITARRENVDGYQYTSARMKTQGRKSWRHGRIEARIKMPSFMGSWPAFWMLGDNITSVGWPKCGEIDIMEHVNTENLTHGTIHWEDHNNLYANYSGSTSTNVTQYQIYAVEWDSNSIKWFLNGNLYHEASIAGGVNGTSEFQNTFFILLNMAIGGNWPGFDIDNSAFPAKMYVDYVRVYKAGSDPNPSKPVTLYQHCNYGGYAVGLNEGTYTLSQLQSMGMVDNDISSLKVASGYTARLYQNNNFSGSSILLSGDDNCLVNENFNDITTSVTVSKSSGSWSTRIEAENYALMNGVQTEPCNEGGLNVGYIDPGDWMVWDVNLPSSGSYTVSYRIASLNGGGSFQLEKAGGSPIYGSLSVPNTNGWQNWTTISHQVNLSAGQQQIAIYTPNGGFNLNWIEISQGSRAVKSDEANEIKDQISLGISEERNLLLVSGIAEGLSYSIYNLSGKELLKDDLNVVSKSHSIDISGLSTGVYVFKDLKSGISLKFIK